jgi:hypothetical protein
MKDPRMKGISGFRLGGTYVRSQRPHDLQRTSTKRTQAPVSSVKSGITTQKKMEILPTKSRKFCQNHVNHIPEIPYGKSYLP